MAARRHGAPALARSEQIELRHARRRWPVASAREGPAAACPSCCGLRRSGRARPRQRRTRSPAYGRGGPARARGGIPHTGFRARREKGGADPVFSAQRSLLANRTWWWRRPTCNWGGACRCDRSSRRRGRGWPHARVAPEWRVIRRPLRKREGKRCVERKTDEWRAG